MRLLSIADNRLARARPPLRPNALAISDAFMSIFYLALSIRASRSRHEERHVQLPVTHFEAQPCAQWGASAMHSLPACVSCRICAKTGRHARRVTRTRTHGWPVAQGVA
jgi:hypothetical protein